MRVVAGKYRGKNLISPPDDRVRPTTTRIKETLFNVLQGHIVDARVLDLFAGSGALGIECISRGAAEVVFNDKSRDSVALINQNLKGIEGNYRVTCQDFLSSLSSAKAAGRQFDVIFLDPPYATDLAERALKFIFAENLLADDGVIVFEHGGEKTYTVSNPAYKARTKRMGTITAEFISKKRVGLMTGSFDPVTKGHEELLTNALRQYDEVVVACLVNEDKTYLFNPAQRLALASAMCAAHKGARALFSERSAVEVAREVGATRIIRGIRNAKDEEYEREMAAYNGRLGVDTEFVEVERYGDISSTLVREQIKRGDYSNLPAACVPIIVSAEFKELQ